MLKNALILLIAVDNGRREEFPLQILGDENI
jgi:hypothetical protein